MKKTRFTKIILLILSLLIIFNSFIIKDKNISSIILLLLLIISSIILDVKSYNIVKLSKNNPKVGTFKFILRISLFMVIFFIMISILKINEHSRIYFDKNILIITVISLFMIIFGNMSPKIPFNRYLGLRLPWTIRDEQTWRVTHKIVGYLSFPLSIIIFVLSFFFNSNIVITLGILLWVIIPSIYSLIFYYKKINGLN